MQWYVLFQKEVVENWRNRKLIWVPLALILIAILDPVSTYYLPQILEFSGGLPEGTVIDIPEPMPEEVVMMSLEQLSMFGVLIVILICMGTIAGERKNGLSEIILVKPIKYSNYITSKWIAHLFITLIGLLSALAMSFYYITVLFGHINVSVLIKAALFYTIWFIFIVSLSIFYNVICHTPSYVASFTIITVILMSIINLIFEQQLTIFPNKLSPYIYELLLTKSVSNDLALTAILTLLLSIILVTIAIFIFKRKEKTS